MPNAVHQAAAALRKFALSFPEAYEDHPWGERVIKVKKKIFVFLGPDTDKPDELGVCVKLPISGAAALTLPFVAPAGYGLGRSGWVMARLKKVTSRQVEQFKCWIDESYRTVAPKKLVTKLDGDDVN